MNKQFHTKNATTLIAGFGNLLRGDDGFGVRVIKQLSETSLPDSVEVMDVGIGGMNFLLKLMDGYEKVIVVDVVKRDADPGTLHVFDPGNELEDRPEEPLDPHNAEPHSALSRAKSLDILPGSVAVVGCEPLRFGLSEDMSEPVANAVEPAVECIRDMLP